VAAAAVVVAVAVAVAVVVLKEIQCLPLCHTECSGAKMTFSYDNFENEEMINLTHCVSLNQH
jgi:hypothetical protein